MPWQIKTSLEPRRATAVPAFASGPPHDPEEATLCSFFFSPVALFSALVMMFSM